MWCYKHNVECYLSNNFCNCCPYEFSQIQQFNYECPDCHGKFNYTAYKYFQICTENSMTGYYANACPFCGRLMEGLK